MPFLFFFRSRFLKQSNDNFPCSLVMLKDDEVLGHVRLSKVIGEPKSLFLTSGKKLLFARNSFQKC